MALYSRQPYQWITAGPDAGQEIAAPGRQNIFIVQMARAAVDGSFDQFIQEVSGAELSTRGLDVVYQASGVGEVRFGWNGPLTLDGAEVALHEYPRWQNPYTTVEFGSRMYDIEYEGKALYLDFERGTREVREQEEP